MCMVSSEPCSPALPVSTERAPRAVCARQLTEMFLPCREWKHGPRYCSLVTILKTKTFCDTAFCSLVQFYRRFRGAYHLHNQDYNRLNEGCSKHLRNACQLLAYYTAKYPRIQSRLLEPSVVISIEWISYVSEISSSRTSGWVSVRDERNSPHVDTAHHSIYKT
jgi:hypothetical protein